MWRGVKPKQQDVEGDSGLSRGRASQHFTLGLDAQVKVHLLPCRFVVRYHLHSIVVDFDLTPTFESSCFAINEGEVVVGLPSDRLVLNLWNVCCIWDKQGKGNIIWKEPKLGGPQRCPQNAIWHYMPIVQSKKSSMPSSHRGISLQHPLPLENSSEGKIWLLDPPLGISLPLCGRGVWIISGTTYFNKSTAWSPPRAFSACSSLPGLDSLRLVGFSVGQADFIGHLLD